MFRFTHILFLCLMLMCSSVALAQTIAVSKSAEFPIDKDITLLGHVHNDGTNNYVLSGDMGSWAGKFTLYLEKFDPKWGSITKKTYEVGRDGDTYIDFYYAENGFTILSNKIDQKDQLIKFFFKRSNMNGDVGKANTINIAFDRKTMGPKVSTLISQDHSKALSFVRFRAPDSQKLSFEFVVSDETGKKIWGKKETLPYLNKMVDLDKMCIDNDGNLYLMVKVYLIDEEKPKGMRGRNAYRYELHRYSAESDNPTVIKLDVKGMGVSYYGLKEADGEICLAGICTNWVDPWESHAAILSLRMSCESGEVTANGLYKITEEDEKMLRYSKGSFATSIFVFDNFDILPNGNMAVSMENFYNTEDGTREGAGRIYCTSSDIFNFFIDGEGIIVEKNRIPRLQKGMINDRPKMSHRVFSQPNGDHYLFFNSNQEHLKAATNNGVLDKSAKDDLIACIKMSPDGGLVSGKLPANMQKKLLNMYATYQISDTQFFFHCQGGGSQAIGIITIE